MAKYGNMHHMQMTIEFARMYVTQHPNSKTFYDGRHVMSDELTLHWLNHLEKDGYKYVPECTNINSEGKCLGHIE